jgi:cobalt-zinc-cadmium efflux system outer membrane protein
MLCGWRVGAGFTLAAALAANAGAQTAFTWTEILAKFETANPTLRVDQLGVDESKANEISAFLRPNPQFSVTADQIGHNDAGRPFADMINVFAVNYLHERQHKRELRRDSARQATDIAMSGHGNLDRTLVFTLRSTFVQVLMSKAALTLARDNLDFYDRVLAISRDRYQAGDLAQIDMDRLELQRVQFESAVEDPTADVARRSHADRTVRRQWAL